MRHDSTNYPSPVGCDRGVPEDHYGRPRYQSFGWRPSTKRPGGWREAHAIIIPVDRGMETPCWRWCGRYKDGRPTIRTRWTTYAPVKLWMENHCREGHIESLCGFSDCVRPDHHEVTP